jgi:hypothetical protein
VRPWTAWLLAAALGGCATTSEGALDISLGLARADVPAALHRHDYCAGPAAAGDEQTFPRCEHPGVDWHASWVVVDFDHGGRLRRVRRWERWSDDARALDRWNQLIAARARVSGGPSPAARRAMEQVHALPAGTRSWQAFRAGDGAIAAVYLLAPEPPENASILEEIVRTPAGTL